MLRTALIALFLLQFALSTSAQQRYYNHVTEDIVMQFKDSSNRVITSPEDSIRKYQFNYVLSFFPNILVKNISLDYRFTKNIVSSRARLFSVVKNPSQRRYKVTFSKSTASSMDSVIIHTLSFDSQIGLIANQISIIEDLSTGGVFNFLKFYARRMTAKGKNKIYRDAEERTLEVGLGNQLLAYNLEFIDKLKIENWQSISGYDNYIRYYRNRPMKPDLVRTFLSDLPVYIQNRYQ